MNLEFDDSNQVEIYFMQKGLRRRYKGTIGGFLQRITNRKSTQLALATGGSFVPLRTLEHEVPGTDCRQSFEGGFRSGGCGRDHDTIGAPAYAFL